MGPEFKQTKISTDLRLRAWSLVQPDGKVLGIVQWAARYNQFTFYPKCGQVFAPVHLTIINQFLLDKTREIIDAQDRCKKD